MSTAYDATYAVKPAIRNNASLQDSNFNDLTAEMKEWRSQIEATSATDVSENKTAPSDSAGYYWASLKMALYADRPHSLERIQISTNEGLRFYYRSLSFWQASAAVNLPSRIGALNYSGLNGFDGRCVAYGCALAVLTEMKFPDGSAELTLEFSEASLPRKSNQKQEV